MDDSSLGEKMNRALGLDPGFSVDHPSLVDSVRDMTDDTTKRAQKNLDQQRKNQADIAAIAAEIAAERELPASIDAPILKGEADALRFHEYPAKDEADGA